METKFSNMMSDYLSWKVRFRFFLKGQTPLSESEIVSHKDCELGRWLYSQGISQYGTVPEIIKLEKIHKRLHKSVLNIVSLKRRFADFRTVKEEVMHFESLFMNFFFLLDTLRRTLK